MVSRKACLVCGASKAQSCKKCGGMVCRAHGDFYFDEVSRNLTLLCRNCGRALRA